MTETDKKPLAITRRRLLGTALGAGAAFAAYKWVTGGQYRAETADRSVDVLLIGGGIMSATLGVMLSELEPEWRIETFERLSNVAEESSNGWNNAGTGHSALCELNYTPQDEHGNVQISRAIAINEQFQISRQFWAHQVRAGILENPRTFINSTPHMSLCWGADNVTYITKRVEALKASPLFAGMEITTDPAKIAEWIPLAMAGRKDASNLVATRSSLGTDVNLGEITRQFFGHLTKKPTFTLTTGVEVRSITRNPGGSWRVSAFDMNDDGKIQTVDAGFVFIGAGGAALPLLQLSGIEEGKAYAGFPVGGSFLVTENEQVAAQHLAKVYGKADVGSPPMSVPHLDTRVLDGKRVLLFGPFATWSSKFLKHGSYFDLPDSVTLSNVAPMMQVGWNEMALVNYLAGQLVQSREAQLAELRRYYPEAKDEDWRLWQAGQRVQIIYNDPKKGGVLKLGTEVVMAKDRSIAALLGASPGGSTSPAVMLGLLEKAFPDQVGGAWKDKLNTIIPSYGRKLNGDTALLASVWKETADALQLALPSPDLTGVAAGASAPAAGAPPVDREIKL
ncbi:putative malate:quinone oxidoreductase [Methylopila jiangsuensis]|uniref:Probable malate:quinone oxidoreductase n=1 Tax=Methylopila jiangsuensis TaxID=586230 RepID=A0A9W6N2E8_9HYPH|nr:malate dehydrogenase (quinone) [Methylopila jiangsuensis]MDR6286134.1 malate dehydrogenase (quinone) [Methylopila jiangsuensis]GLK75894.1 putative malate:quinone oxidoreductase [Methylopila jiangsuensis]